MRPAQDEPSGYSATPIYDALYSEYRRSFRALPGDRSGEEDLGFKSFGVLAAADTVGTHGTEVHNGGTGSGTHGHGQGLQTQHGAGYAAARPYPGPVPAALPPAPRRGL
ncbi:hypothetical protein [Streptomyces sp. TRM49041]|uniref:hypothetical protein n=1 Tax=Streptomyces sp. TRM49041 TaxID=2603216 RepID=UPI0011ED0AEA|nr:hypothetical protein [Streptomyces sp. TRM49041]